MVLKPLNSDGSEVGGSDEWGFFGPFYQGWSYFQINVYFFRPFFYSSANLKLISQIFLDFKRRFARLLEGDSFRSMEYKLAMRFVSKLQLQISFSLIC